MSALTRLADGGLFVSTALHRLIAAGMHRCNDAVGEAEQAKSGSARRAFFVLFVYDVHLSIALDMPLTARAEGARGSIVP
jgi:hypothetical protein